MSISLSKGLLRVLTWLKCILYFSTMLHCSLLLLKPETWTNPSRNLDWRLRAATLGTKVAFHLCGFTERRGRTKRDLSRLQGGSLCYTPAKPLTVKNSGLLLLKCHKSTGGKEKIHKSIRVWDQLKQLGNLCVSLFEKGLLDDKYEHCSFNRSKRLVWARYKISSLFSSTRTCTCTTKYL